MQKTHIRKAHINKEWGTLFIFLVPYFTLLIIFKVLPIAMNFVYSLQDLKLIGTGKYVAWKNYNTLFHDNLFWKAVRNTFEYLLYVGPVNVVFGFLLALLLNQRLKGTIAVRTSVFMPYVMMITLVGITWRWMLDGNNGIINYYLGMIGIGPIYWITTQSTAMIGIAITSIWWTIGYNMVIYLAALQDIPKELKEAAQIDGANPMQQLVRITIPLVKNATFYCVITTVIYSMQMFGQAYVMTGGGPNYATLSIVQYMYIRGFREMKMSYASTIGVALFILIIVLSGIVYVAFLDRDDFKQKKLRRSNR